MQLKRVLAVFSTLLIILSLQAGCGTSEEPPPEGDGTSQGSTTDNTGGAEEPTGNTDYLYCNFNQCTSDADCEKGTRCSLERGICVPIISCSQDSFCLEECGRMCQNIDGCVNAGLKCIDGNCL